MQIKLREAKSVNLMQALEWLAMSWVPYVDKDDRLAPEDRENIRCYFDGSKIKPTNKSLYTEKQLKYNDRMYKAVAVLENLLNTSKIDLKDNCIINIVCFPHEDTCCRYNELIPDSESKWIDAKRRSIKFFARYNDWKHCICETIDECFDFDELKKIEPFCDDDTKKVQINNKELINDYVINRAKELAANDISNNAAAELIRGEISQNYGIKDGQYPSLQQIRNLILKIIPPKKKLS